MNDFFRDIVRSLTVEVFLALLYDNSVQTATASDH